MTEQEFRSLKSGDPLRYKQGNVRGEVTHCERVNGTDARVRVKWQDGHTGSLRLEACDLVHRLPVPKKHATEVTDDRPPPPRAARRTAETRSPAFGSGSDFPWGLGGGMPGADGGGSGTDPGFSGGGGDASGGGSGSNW